MRLGLDRIVVRILHPADDADLRRLHLEGLALGGRGHDAAARLDRAAAGELLHVGIVGERVRRDDLHRMKRRAVGEMDERDAGLRVAPRAHPAAHGDRRVLGRPPGEHFTYTQERGFHRRTGMGEELNTVYQRTLSRAADILGGKEKLRASLRAPMHRLEAWLAGERPPMDIFLRVVDLIAASGTSNQLQRTEWLRQS